MAQALTMEQKIEKATAKAAARREAAVESATPRERTTATRGKRGTFNGTEGKLRIGHHIDGYHLHIFNDTPGRIEQALNVGYEFVKPDEVGGTAVNVVSRNTDVGDKVRFLVGTDSNNEPQYAYLMKLKQEFYEEDQSALQAKNDAVDAAIRGGKNTGEGHSTDGFYTPQGGIKLSRS
jgi:hypothetical protein